MKIIPKQRSFVFPDWHKTVLTKRLAKVEVGKGEFLTLTQLKKRLQKFVGDDLRSR